MSDITAQLIQQVEAAIADKTLLNIIGGNSKIFYGGEPKGHALHTTQHTGIVNYEPAELVMTARAGTSLEEIENALVKHNQMLPFEPPHYGSGATIGGTIACNFSGPRRAYAGAARDFVLGSQIINGKAEVLKFGGEVMKNVAGYDVSRLMTGAMGTLGVILEISFKVIPRYPAEITLVQECGEADAIQNMNQWAANPNPISASAFIDNKLFIRLSGADTALRAAQLRIGGEVLVGAEVFWQQLREQQLPQFATEENVWRISVPQTTAPLNLPGQQIMEWGGGLRWLVSNESADVIRKFTTAAGGHAILFKGEKKQAVFQPLSATMMALHHKIKTAMDPHGIFNPGRMYPEL